MHIGILEGCRTIRLVSYNEALTIYNAARPALSVSTGLKANREIPNTLDPSAFESGPGVPEDHRDPNTVYSIWRRVCGIWCRAYGIWCRVYGIWCRVYSIWCRVYGIYDRH